MQVPFRGQAALALGLAFGLTLAAAPAAPAAARAGTDAYLDTAAAQWEEVARKIWDYAETALHETKSAALLADVLEKEGFAVTRGVAGMPTAFVASAGSGSPPIGILAEYDALPGLSQVAGASRKTPLRGSGASSDVGEVSAAVPLAELGVQTGPTGAPWHHWGVAACAASPVGIKGMFVAAKVLASSVTDLLLKDAGTIAAAKAEFRNTTGGKPYLSPLAEGAVPKVY